MCYHVNVSVSKAITQDCSVLCGAKNAETVYANYSEI